MWVFIPYTYTNVMVVQGRALLNAVGNLGLTGAYGEALNKLGHTLENVASQVEFPVFFHKGCLYYLFSIVILTFTVVHVLGCELSP